MSDADSLPSISSRQAIMKGFPAILEDDVIRCSINQDAWVSQINKYVVTGK